MITFKQGAITNQSGKCKDIVVKAPLPNKVKDILIGSSLVVAGITYLTVTAFKHGSEQYEAAEYKTLVDLGIIKE